MPRFWYRASYRIAVKTALILAAAASILGGGGLLLTRHHIAHSLDARIVAASDRLMVAASGGRDPSRQAIAAAILRSEDQIAVALFDPQGNRILGELKVSLPLPGWSNVSFYDPVEGSDPARVLATDLPTGDRLVVAGNRRPLEAANEAIRWLWGLAAATILILCASLAVLLGRHLDGRLDPIARTADAVLAGDLTRRVPASPRGDEFDRVAISLNTMLDRVSSLMANLRAIAGDIAHDLRTPLGRLRVKLELAQADPDAAGSREEIIGETISAIDEILLLFRAVLRIAEIEEGGGIGVHEQVALGRLATEVFEAMQPVFEEAGLILHQEITPGLTVTGDREQLAAAIINVLENALTHSSLGTIVTLCVAQDGAEAEVKISDSGPGVPDADLERIFDRFVRLDAARSTPGYGLGLSLVRAVALANKGTVIARNEPMRFAIVFRFPLSSD